MIVMWLNIMTYLKDTVQDVEPTSFEKLLEKIIGDTKWDEDMDE